MIALDARNKQLAISRDGEAIHWSTRPFCVMAGPEQRLVQCDIETRENGGVSIHVADPDIQAPLVFRFPLPDSIVPYNRDWKLWAASKGYPLDLYDVVEHHVSYGGPDGGVVIPALCIYNAKKDIGLTFTKPFDHYIPDTGFVVRMDEEKYVDVVYNCFAAGSIKQFTLDVYAHRGDYRCALGALFEVYEEYFTPNNPDVSKKWFYISQSGIKNENPIDRIANLRANIDADTYSEVHHYYPAYGDYFPENRDEWMNVRVTEGRDAEARHITKAELVEHLDTLAASDVRPLMYMQISGDCYKKLAEEQFSDSILLDCDGKPYEAWVGTVLANGSLQYSFGKHLKSTIERMLAYFGSKCSGLFVDQMCYGQFDYAHSDGVTEKHGKPAFKVTEVYKEHMDYLLPMMRDRGQYIMGNGPWNVEVGKGLDALMAEGTGWLIEHFSSLALARPMIAFYYTDDPFTVETTFMTSLKYGAFPGCPSWKLGENTNRILPDYVDFFPLLAGRKWVFDPQPVEFQQGWDGNIFELSSGGYVVYLYKTLGIDCKSVSVKIKLPSIGNMAVERVFTRGGVDSACSCSVAESDGNTSMTVDIEASNYVYAVVLKPK